MNHSDHEPQSLSDSPLPLVVEGHAPFSRLGRFLRVTAFALCVPLVFVIIKTRQADSRLSVKISESRESLASLEDELDRLNREQAEMDREIQQRDSYRRQLQRMYGQFRDVNDLPNIRSPFIVHYASSFGSPMNSMLSMSLPDGSHDLQIVMTREEPETKEVLEKQSLRYELVGAAGYVVLLDLAAEQNKRYRDPRQLTLRISSNQPSFESIVKPLFEPFPPPSSSSSAGNSNNLVMFPNQFQPRDESGSLLVNAMRWSIVPEDAEAFDLVIEMRLTSGGPLVADPETASRLRYLDESLETEYVGNGRFLVKKKPDMTSSE